MNGSACGLMGNFGAGLHEFIYSAQTRWCACSTTH